MIKKIIFTLAIIFILNSIGFSSAISIEYKSLKKVDIYDNNRFFYNQKYSIIIVGTYGTKNQEDITNNPRSDYYYWFTGSVMRRFTLLNKTYGFAKENIYILLTEIHKDEFKPHENFDSTQFAENNYMNATKENITKVFNFLKEKICENDLLTVDLIGHGSDDNAVSIPFISKLTGKYYDSVKGIYASDTFMPLENPKNGKSRTFIKPRIKNIFSFIPNFKYSNNASSGEYRLYDYELKDLSFNINAKRIIFILQPCHSGGFINDLSKENHVIITSCNEGEVAGDFLGPFNNGLDGAADLNSDGKISLSEAFVYGSENKREYFPDIYPLIDDNGDKIGHKNIGIDGDIASKIYNLSYEEI